MKQLKHRTAKQKPPETQDPSWRPLEAEDAQSLGQRSGFWHYVIVGVNNLQPSLCLVGWRTLSAQGARVSAHVFHPFDLCTD